jgi:predicted  nucleic acid-binding Zn-ribbon protein
MKSLRHHCSNCDSKFTIGYDELVCEDDPKFCPFCSEYILEDELEQDEDY